MSRPVLQAEPLVGVKDAAALLARRTGLPDVQAADVKELIERRLIPVVMNGDWPLMKLEDLDRFAAVKELAWAGERRRAWWAVSIDRWDAAHELGVTLARFDALAAAAGLQTGRFRRYWRTQVMRPRP